VTIPSTAPAAPTIDASKASGVPCLMVDEHEVLSTLSLGHMIQLVPNPTLFEDKRMQPALLSSAMADLADKRETIQRYFTGAKKTNLPRYADFIFERVTQQAHRGTPTMCLGYTSKLTVIPMADGTARVAIPYGRLFLAVDGETQRAAWEMVNNRVYDLIKAGMAPEDILDNVRIPVEIHHGLSVEQLQALFYERNVLGAKVNANEAISKDQRDPATQIARNVMNMPIRQPNGQMVPTLSIVQQQSRQVGKKAPEWITLSALRTLVVCAILGRPGLQYGAKPIPMVETVDFEVLKSEVSEIVHAILQQFADKFTDKDRYLIGSPSIMAGIGVAAHRTIKCLPDRPEEGPLTVEEFLDLLSDIRWDKEGMFWDGIGTRKTPKGATTVAGPKEVGYAVADAIGGINEQTAAQIRGHATPAPTVPAGAVQAPIPGPVASPWLGNRSD
jgi:DNA-sulfur modification-associated